MCRFYTACFVHKMAISVAGSAAKRVGQIGHAGSKHVCFSLKQ